MREYFLIMGGKLALVVGSECDAQNSLGFTNELATRLYGDLCRLGGWQSAIAVDGPVLDPTVCELKAAVIEAFSTASQQQATLLISFIGHGKSTQSKLFYLLAKDSDPEQRLDSDTAYNLGTGITEQLIPARLDGLIVLIDACESGAGVGNAEDWVDALDPRSGRIELLVASERAGAAYSGCFTRTMLDAFAHGLPQQGTFLRPSDLRPHIANACRRQLPIARSSATGGDPGLWLVPNVSRVRDAVHGRPSAGFVDQLTGGPAISRTLHRRAAEIYADTTHRLRTVVGPAGCGKSTLMSLLIRPSMLDRAPFTSDFVTAAVFLDVTSTIETFIDELATQFNKRLDGYAEAVETVASRYIDPDILPDQIELVVLLPLALVRPLFGQITLIIDGLDQPEEGAKAQICAAIGELTRRANLAHVRAIVGIRHSTEAETIPDLVHQEVYWIDAPTDHDIIATVREAHSIARSRDGGPEWQQWLSSIRTQTTAGGWLLARLMIELRTLDDDDIGQIALDTLIQRRIHQAVDDSGPDAADAIAAVLAVVAAAGSGPVFPLSLLHVALPALGITTPASRIRDLIANLGALISRGNPGTSNESLGLAHTDFQQSIQWHLSEHGIAPRDAHYAILAAINCTQTDAVTKYARDSAVRHYLAVGDPEGAILHLNSLNTANAADNRDRWETWLPLFIGTLGPDHPDTFITRSNLASWRGESGDLAGAITEFEQLLADRLRVLGPEHPYILATRNNLASWRGENGDVTGAITEYEQLLTDRLRVLGPDHPDTLATRNNLAAWRGESGDVTGAIAEFEQLLTDHLRVLGPDHPDTLATRNNLASWRGRSGDVAGAITEYQQLLTDRLRVLGPDHPDTLATRNNLGSWRGESGDVTGAIAEFEQLLTDRLRVLGPDHPDTLTSRSNLASWHGESGDVAGAITEFEQLLTDRLRVLGPDHPDTLATRSNLASWHGESGDVAGAITEFQQLLTDHLRVLGPDHPDTLVTRSNLAAWRGRSGDVAGAITEYEQLLTDRLRVLGPDHPDTLTTRGSLASWRGRSGDVAGAITEFQQLLTDHLRVLGPDHPDTLVIRGNLAAWRGRSGDVAGAITEYEQLLTDRLRVLGPDHPDTLVTRSNLASWHGESGDVAGAITEFQQLLTDHLRVLGPDHPDTLTTRSNLAAWHGESGDVAGAITEYEQLLTDRLRALGSDHPDTVATRSYLDVLLESRPDPPE
ncbi:tetratricopeptide repeat protein [Nocardia sp. CDC153]|uniref:tetratricopeptide repeat protein n=1 Tax=Nocardia sp. CDC153 TaxID=3112167 RepID=UPI002DBD3F4E|nr:tetratricopeptide repeat protein [Nocardia sp. CDC153]MEC3953785.1 tetratricopeptide repeat protein [Nocardia sp. CDC153]